jgi:hypothetical protein
MSMIRNAEGIRPADAPGTGQLLAIAAVVAAVLFGLAGLVGSFGYLRSVSRKD